MEMINEKKCNYCQQEIEFKKHGLTKYCSTQCRNKDYYKKNKLKSDNYSENESTKQNKIEKSNEQEYIRDFNERNSEPNTNQTIFRNEGGENRTSHIYPNEFFRGTNDLVRYYDAKVEATRYELKCQYLENRIRELETEVMRLESELEEIENEEDSNSVSMIGGLVNSFKTDPINTLEFGKQMFDKIFNKKSSTDS